MMVITLHRRVKAARGLPLSCAMLKRNLVWGMSWRPDRSSTCKSSIWTHTCQLWLIAASLGVETHN
jgi:hypothetical protein